MGKLWSSCSVLCVSDLKSVFPVKENKLRIRQDWGYQHEGRELIAQASRQGCALIRSCAALFFPYRGAEPQEGETL